MEVVLHEAEELVPDAPVVRVARDVGHAGVAPDRLGHGPERALALEQRRHLGDPLDEDEGAHAPERVVQRVQDGEEEHRRAGDARGHVAQDVELGAPRALRTVLEHRGHAARLQRGAQRAADVDVRVRAAPARLAPLRGEAALELGDHPVHGGEVLQRPRGQRAVELVQRPRRAAGCRCARSARARAPGAGAPRSAGSARGSAARRPRPPALGRRARRAGRARGGSAARPRRARRSPRRGGPSAAMARRARSRIAASSPSRIAVRSCSRSASTSTCSPPRPPSPAGALLAHAALHRLAPRRRGT